MTLDKREYFTLLTTISSEIGTRTKSNTVKADHSVYLLRLNIYFYNYYNNQTTP